MIDFLVAIFWVGLVVISVTITLAHMDRRARRRAEQQKEEGHP